MPFHLFLATQTLFILFKPQKHSYHALEDIENSNKWQQI